jgi:hypothetical protein
VQQQVIFAALKQNIDDIEKSKNIANMKCIHKLKRTLRKRESRGRMAMAGKPKNLTLKCFDIFELTGLLPPQFLEIWESIKDMLYGNSPFHKKLSLPLQLLLVLFWLRNGCKLKVLTSIFFISKATSSRIIRWMLPRLLVGLRKSPARIELPQVWDGVCRIVGAIDCTSHFRNRVHPFQSDYYRGDKRGHFLTAQIIVPLDGSKIFSIHLGPGHNNDKGMYIMSGMKQFLVDNRLMLLADGGYGHKETLITPDENKNKRWRLNQQSMRSVVETVIGLVHTWEAATSKFQSTPELQQVALMCIYELVNQFRLHVRPLGIRSKYGEVCDL